MSDDQPQTPRTRLIVPGDSNKPRARLIAPAVEAATDREAEEDAEAEVGASPPDEAVPVSVAPLSPPPDAPDATDAPDAADALEAEEGEPAIGEAEQGEFTVIDEDTGETHTVPVKISSLAPPPVARPDPEVEGEAGVPDEADAGAQWEAEEAARQQAAYEAELAAYEAAQQQAAYEAELAAYEAAQQQAAYEEAARRTQAAYYPPQVGPRVPHAGGYAPRSAAAYGPMPVVMGGGVPGWALIMIGLLIGFVASVLAYKFTDFGKMIRPDAKRPVEQQSSVSDDPASERHG